MQRAVCSAAAARRGAGTPQVYPVTSAGVGSGSLWNRLIGLMQALCCAVLSLGLIGLMQALCCAVLSLGLIGLIQALCCAVLSLGLIGLM